MDFQFHNQQPGFWITIMVGFRVPLAGFQIPKLWIPDSTDQNYLDSGFQITLCGAMFTAIVVSKIVASKFHFML